MNVQNLIDNVATLMNIDTSKELYPKKDIQIDLIEKEGFIIGSLKVIYQNDFLVNNILNLKINEVIIIGNDAYGENIKKHIKTEKQLINFIINMRRLAMQ